MFNYRTEQALEELVVASWFAEGSGAFRPGKAYASTAALVAAAGRHTTIYANLPATSLADGATTADALVNRFFFTIANTGATALLDITSAAQGILYRIQTASLTNATTIAQAAKFSTITAAWNPVALGDYLEVIYDKPNAKFYEYARVVNGVYTKNAALVAPEYIEA